MLASSLETLGAINISSGDTSTIKAAQFFNKLVKREHMDINEYFDRILIRSVNLGMINAMQTTHSQSFKK